MSDKMHVKDCRRQVESVSGRSQAARQSSKNSNVNALFMQSQLETHTGPWRVDYCRDIIAHFTMFLQDHDDPTNNVKALRRVVIHPDKAHLTMLQ